MYEYDIQNLDHKDPCTDPFDQPEVKLDSRHRRGWKNNMGVLGIGFCQGFEAFLVDDL